MLVVGLVLAILIVVGVRTAIKQETKPTVSSDVATTENKATSSINASTPEKKATSSISVTTTANHPNYPDFKILYNVQFEQGTGPENSYAKTTTMVFDSINHVSTTVERVNTWAPYGENPQPACSTSDNFRMTPAQINKFGYKQGPAGYQVWDRGHLTPAQPNLFALDPMTKTHVCVNVAAQEPQSNRFIWRCIEKYVSKFLKAEEAAGVIVTGISQEVIGGPDGITAGNYRTPSYFWKLVCYKKVGYPTAVLGFRIDNSLFKYGDTDIRKQRRKDAITARNQNEIAPLAEAGVIDNSWNQIHNLKIGRPSKNSLPTPAQCSNTQVASEAAKAAWTTFVTTSFDEDEECTDD